MVIKMKTNIPNKKAMSSINEVISALKKHNLPSAKSFDELEKLLNE